ILLALSGALVRHAMVTKNIKERWLTLPAAAGFAALVLITAQSQAVPSVGIDNIKSVDFKQVQAIFARHCTSCHSQTPTDEIFTVAPKGLIFETEEQIKLAAQSIYQQVVVSKV